jgi:hypothetical protein
LNRTCDRTRNLNTSENENENENDLTEVFLFVQLEVNVRVRADEMMMMKKKRYFSIVYFDDSPSGLCDLSEAAVSQIEVNHITRTPLLISLDRTVITNLFQKNEKNQS